MDFVHIKKILRGKRGLALDIDDTLSVTRLFWFEEKQRLFGNPENLTARKMIKKYGYTYLVPYWNTEEVKKWADEIQISKTYWENLPLIDGSSEAVKKIDARVPILLYLTGRPDHTLKSTNIWLEKHGFPKRPVLAQPNSQYGKANEWKGRTLAALYPEVRGIIDDNPELISNLPEDYKGTIYLYNNTKHPKTLIRVIPCPTWNSVVEAVQSASIAKTKNLV